LKNDSDIDSEASEISVLCSDQIKRQLLSVLAALLQLKTLWFVHIAS